MFIKRLDNHRYLVRNDDVMTNDATHQRGHGDHGPGPEQEVVADDGGVRGAAACSAEN